MQLTFPLALGLLFVALKLTGVIAWPWLWVLLPFWIGLVSVLAFFLVAGLVLLLVLPIKAFTKRPRNGRQRGW
jgi:hypothetical protein